jgi:hypothetical protein
MATGADVLQVGAASRQHGRPRIVALSVRLRRERRRYHFLCGLRSLRTLKLRRVAHKSGRRTALNGR